MSSSIHVDGVAYDLFEEEDELSDPTHYGGSQILVRKGSTRIPFEKYESSYYSSFYIKNWAHGVVPAPMLGQSGFIDFGKIITRENELMYVEDSYDVFRASGRKLYSYQYSYINKEWRDWCRGKYGHYHNAMRLEDKSFLAIKEDRLQGMRQHVPRNKAFVISWHQDQQNYWHFTYDVCTRLMILAEHHDVQEMVGIDFLVIGKPLKLFQEDLVSAILGFKPMISYYRGAVCVESVIHIPITNSGFIDQSACKSLRRRIASGIASVGPQVSIISGSSRIYIERGSAVNGRRILNESCLMKMLRKYSFEIFDPGQLSVHEQVNIFSNAEMIIGSHGSAFVNGMHCHNGLVVELVDQSYDPIHDYIITRLNDVRFLRIKSNKRPCQGLSGYSHQDFECDIEKVERLVRLEINSMK